MTDKEKPSLGGLIEHTRGASAPFFITSVSFVGSVDALLQPVLLGLTDFVI